MYNQSQPGGYHGYNPSDQFNQMNSNFNGNNININNNNNNNMSQPTGQSSSFRNHPMDNNNGYNNVLDQNTIENASQQFNGNNIDSSGGMNFYSSAPTGSGNQQGLGENAPQRMTNGPQNGNTSFFQGMNDMNVNLQNLDPQNNHMVNAGLTLGKDYLESNVKKYIPLVSSNWLLIKYYFSVNNDYVLKKISILLAPWTQKKWKRSLDTNGEGHVTDGVGTKYAKALEDLNAPDLYIPIMAFISYALVVGYAKGGVGEFTPETIVQVISTCLVTQILEVMIMTLGLYLMRCNANLGDLFSYTGYKYVPLSLHMILAFIIGNGWVNTFVFIYFAIATAYFMIKTLTNGIYTTHATGAALPKEAVVIGSGVLQVITMWYLSYSDGAPQ